jgi:tetratricopeptide (TPR) repeat protein
VFERARRFPRAAELLGDEVESALPGERAQLLRHLARVVLDEVGDARRACSALEDLARDTETTPADEELWARALEALGRSDEALARRRAALEKLGARARSERWVELAEAWLSRRGDAAEARAVCDRALALDPADVRALRLRADLSRRLGEARAEAADAARLAEALASGTDAAEAFARAAHLTRGDLRDPSGAATLYARALERDPTCVEALLGAGEIALDRGDAERAERALALVCGLLDGAERGPRLARAARAAAEAAVLLGRDAEALQHLELARRELPGDAGVLDRIAEVSLRAGAAGTARDALEARLAQEDLDAPGRARRLRDLATALELAGDRAGAREALEQVLSLEPSDGAALERLVSALEQSGDAEGALARLERWLEVAPAHEQPPVVLRVARTEAALGRHASARSRLQALAERGALPKDGWPDLVAWTLAESGPEEALRASARALLECEDRDARARLLWTEAQALLPLRREADAARRACEALQLDPTRLDAGRLLAAHLGQVGDWSAAVAALEQAVAVGAPSPALEAELREAIGRAYAGPLEDLERARAEYRRALAKNPPRASVREALADSTAFDPATHAESLALHAALLGDQPSRVGSWRGLGRIAAHQHRESIQLTAEAVLQALSSAADRATHDARPPLVVDLGAAPDPSLAAASDLLAALQDVDALPATLVVAPFNRLPAVVQGELTEICGRAWQLEDEVLRGLWAQLGDDGESPLQALPWRIRRRLRQALRSPDVSALRRLDPSVWRGDLLARAAARALARRQLTVADALQGLVVSWPATSHVNLHTTGSLAAVAPTCPPARALLGRIADACLSGLGHSVNARGR